MIRISNVIRSYKKEEFEKIPEQDMIRFLGAPIASLSKRLMADNANHLKILKTWEDHFREVKSPYIVTKDKDGTLYLWKGRA